MLPITFDSVLTVKYLSVCVILLMVLLQTVSTSASYHRVLGDLSRAANTGPGVCKTLGGLTREQQEVCIRYPAVTMAGIQGLQSAVRECQHQFRWHRWNCSSLATKNRNPHTSYILRRGYRESAFAHSIVSAGVAHAVARACSQGRLLECGCERYWALGANAAAKGITSPASPRAAWKWGGCSHNLEFGLHFSRKFLDIRESNNGDIQSRVNLHNNEAGRIALADHMEVRCKCHGVSGSCELKTCWRAAPDLRAVGVALKDKFRGAVMVEESNTGPGRLVVVERRRTAKGANKAQKRRKRRRRRPKRLASSLLYYQKSPSFCERDPLHEVLGTQGRQCHRAARGVDSCASLCCGRGYNIIRRRRSERCDCKFHWCCHVTCNNCTVDEWITVCK